MLKFFISILMFIFTFTSVNAGDEQALKQKTISKITNTFSAALETIIGKGAGDTEVRITGTDPHPSWSIMSVRPISVHPEVDAWFLQLQLNEGKIRSDDPRYSINAGLGYRKLSDDQNIMTGYNVFLDWDQEGNTRASLGLELRTAAFEAILNYYEAISSGVNVQTFTERTLGGYEIDIIGQVPYLPWANVVFNHYEWQADKNSKDSTGEKISLELTLTPNFIVEAGGDDNNIDGSTNFVKAYLVFPARERVAASNNFFGESAFSKVSMSGELLSKVRRSNVQVIESEGTGVVIGRAQ